jgi:hypothetical protein
MFSAGNQGQSAAGPAQQQSTVFQFGKQASTAGSSNATQGYNFSLGTGLSLNFASTATPTFSATSNTAPTTAPTTELNKRVIKRAARRKK